MSENHSAVRPGKNPSLDLQIATAGNFRGAKSRQVKPGVAVEHERLQIPRYAAVIVEVEQLISSQHGIHRAGLSRLGVSIKIVTHVRSPAPELRGHICRAFGLALQQVACLPRIILEIVQLSLAAVWIHQELPTALAQGKGGAQMLCLPALKNGMRMAILPEQRPAALGGFAQEHVTAIEAIEILFNRRPRELAKSRRKIHRADNAPIVHHTGGNPARPTRDKGHANAPFVERPFASAIRTRESSRSITLQIFFGAIGWAVVTRENNQRLFTQSQFVDFINQAADLVIHVFEHGQKLPIIRIVRDALEFLFGPWSRQMSRMHVVGKIAHIERPVLVPTNEFDCVVRLNPSAVDAFTGNHLPMPQRARLFQASGIEAKSIAQSFEGNE